MSNALPRSTDKSNSGRSLFANGSRSAPAQPLLGWHGRVSQPTVAAEQVLAQRYGTAPRRTWMTGISNGGYLTRWQPDQRPELYDGGVDWEGSLFQSQGPNLFPYLPTALRDYPTSTVDPAARQPGSPAARQPGSPAARQPGSSAAPVRHWLRARVGLACGLTATPPTET